jgi:hypothetical protein
LRHISGLGLLEGTWPRSSAVIIRQVSEFRRTIGENIAGLRRVGKSGSGLVTRTPDRSPLVAHSPRHSLAGRRLLRRKSRSQCRAERRSSSVPPQRNRNELGGTAVNKT